MNNQTPVIEQMYVRVKDDPIDTAHLIDRDNQQPFCGAAIEGKKWEVLSGRPSLVLACGDCLVKLLVAVRGQ